MVVEQGDCSGKCSIAIHAYENKGTGGKFQKGDGAYWGDMRGRGVDDYIWISPDGVVNLFPNRNSPENTAEFGDVHKGIWGGVFAPIHTGKDRRSLHIADWDGDGKDDIISVEKRTGKLTIWLSAWDGHKYTPRIIHKNDREYCKEGWGIGYFDNGHHFADIRYVLAPTIVSAAKKSWVAVVTAEPIISVWKRMAEPQRGLMIKIDIRAKIL